MRIPTVHDDCENCMIYQGEIKQLEAENHKLKLTMQLHAGDCCSLNNEVELFKDHWEDAEEECRKLKTKLELAMSQNYCTMCGNILDGYVPPKEKNEH